MILVDVLLVPIHSLDVVETHGRAKPVRVVREVPCPRCSRETDERELARNLGLCVSCCIEAETLTVYLDLTGTD